ncbi:5'-3' exoribonuclease 2 [Clarias magur]|uniref:5'-3' exoribonuclease 2 n=1 Tax=Clarias magur TaxID=1594786 RepID=A0A8J4UV13_CLAMG|nr:5'-3' exoribonuclease 2 [Clarias magur]
MTASPRSLLAVVSSSVPLGGHQRQGHSITPVACVERGAARAGAGPQMASPEAETPSPTANGDRARQWAFMDCGYSGFLTVS